MKYNASSFFLHKQALGMKVRRNLNLQRRTTVTYTPITPRYAGHGLVIGQRCWIRRTCFMAGEPNAPLLLAVSFQRLCVSFLFLFGGGRFSFFDFVLENVWFVALGSLELGSGRCGRLYGLLFVARPGGGGGPPSLIGLPHYIYIYIF